jgi:hypothetical protein
MSYFFAQLLLFYYLLFEYKKMLNDLDLHESGLSGLCPSHMKQLKKRKEEKEVDQINIYEFADSNPFTFLKNVFNFFS